jgi:hypothetical protein
MTNCDGGLYSPTIPDLVTRWRSVVRVTPGSLCLRGKSLPFLFDIMLSGSQNLPGHCGEEKTLLPHAWNLNHTFRYLIRWIALSRLCNINISLNKGMSDILKKMIQKQKKQSKIVLWSRNFLKRIVEVEKKIRILKSRYKKTKFSSSQITAKTKRRESAVIRKLLPDESFSKQ